MKLTKFFSLILSSLLLFSSCGLIDSKYKKEVTYGGVTLEAPYTWLVNTETEDGEFAKIEIEAPAAEKILIIYVLEEKRDWEELLEDYKTTYRNTMPQKQRAISFTDTETKTFHGMKINELEFSGASRMLIYEGRLMVFDKDNKTYTIAIVGPKGFLESEDVKHMLSTFRITG